MRPDSGSEHEVHIHVNMSINVQFRMRSDTTLKSYEALECYCRQQLRYLGHRFKILSQKLLPFALSLKHITVFVNLHLPFQIRRHRHARYHVDAVSLIAYVIIQTVVIEFVKLRLIVFELKLLQDALDERHEGVIVPGNSNAWQFRSLVKVHVYFMKYGMCVRMHKLM